MSSNTTSVTVKAPVTNLPDGDLGDVTVSGGGTVLTVTNLDMAVAVEATDAKVMTGAERTKLTGIETGATADQTGAEIKTAYEAEANAYTDAKDTKLSGIETAADVTDAANVAAAGAAMLGTEDQVLTGGAAVTPKDHGTVTSGTTTIDVGDRPVQIMTNNGASTLAPGAAQGSCLLVVTNAASAGTLTTSGWGHVEGGFDTTNGNKFVCSCIVVTGLSFLSIRAAQ